MPPNADAFFASLADVANRQHEAVGARRPPVAPPSAARRLVRAAYIQPSLELLQEIQRTGDIFFPKRWMDATLGGHRSPAAAQTVRSVRGRAAARATPIGSGASFSRPRTICSARRA